MSFKRLLAAACLCAAASSVFAQINVEDAWVRATVPQQRATGAFMKITSDQPVRLVGASSLVAPTVEVHEMKMEGSVMKMRPVSGIDVLRGRITALTPNAYHVMLLDLKQQVEVGDSVPLTVVFEDTDKKRSSVEVVAQARPLSPPSGPSMPGMASMPR